MIGQAKLDKYDQPLFLITSHKIAIHLVKWAFDLQISLVLSRTGATFSAFQFAESCNMTLIGFARGRKFSVYCNDHRVS